MHKGWKALNEYYRQALLENDRTPIAVESGWGRPQRMSVLTESKTSGHIFRIEEMTDALTEWRFMDYLVEGRKIGVKLHQARRVGGEFIDLLYEFCPRAWTMDRAQEWLEERKWSFAQAEENVSYVPGLMERLEVDPYLEEGRE